MTMSLDDPNRRRAGRDDATRTTRRARALLLRLEDRVFAGPDLAAIAAGLDVSRPGPFRRSYHDPRWDGSPPQDR
jgi:hypothetical protein